MLFQTFRSRLSRFAWLFPLAVMAAGAAFAPLRTLISGETLLISLTPGLFVQIVLLGIWIIAENNFAMSPETPLKQLKNDVFLSIILALLLSFMAGWLLALGDCPWFFILPALIAVLDAFLTSKHGLDALHQRLLLFSSGNTFR
jgi:hypothetical protein